MKVDMITLDAKKAGSVELADGIYGLEPREDILGLVVNWQLAKRRAGTHKVKGRSEISATGRKMYGQKKTGNARHSSRRANVFRGGVLPMALRCALMRMTCPSVCENKVCVMLFPPKSKTVA